MLDKLQICMVLPLFIGVSVLVFAFQLIVEFIRIAGIRKSTIEILFT